jgi:hypothetical protein
MRKIDYTDPMSQYSSRKTAKIVTQRELEEKKAKSEWTEQLNFCKWLKNEYPDILFRSDIQSAGKLSGQMQNIKQIIDPYSGWPDVIIYISDMPNYCGLMIEMKSTTASLSGEHYRNQLTMHKRLEAIGWDVHVCKGAEEAKKIFLEYVK